jgi:hypothetical protein
MFTGIAQRIEALVIAFRPIESRAVYMPLLRFLIGDPFAFKSMFGRPANALSLASSVNARPLSVNQKADVH